MVTAVYTAPSWPLSAPPRVEVVSGLVRQDNSCRAGGSARTVSKIYTCQRGGVARVNTLGGPAVANQTKPISSDSLQVRAELVVSASQRKEKKTIQIF